MDKKIRRYLRRLKKELTVKDLKYKATTSRGHFFTGVKDSWLVNEAGKGERVIINIDKEGEIRFNYPDNEHDNKTYYVCNIEDIEI